MMIAGCMLARRVPTLTEWVAPSWLSGTSSDGVTWAVEGNCEIVGIASS
jgi:hypothetical protein